MKIDDGEWHLTKGYADGTFWLERYYGGQWESHLFLKSDLERLFNELMEMVNYNETSRLYS